MSFWRYRGRCIGRVLHFLYHYVGFDAAEYATIGDGVVELHGRRIATFAWSLSFGEKDVPVFSFIGDDALRCEENQAAKREAAVLDALPEAPPLEDRKPVDDDVLHAIIPDAAREIRMWTQVCEKTQPSYFVSDKTLWCKSGKKLLYWSRGLGAWLRGPAENEEAKRSPGPHPPSGVMKPGCQCYTCQNDPALGMMNPVLLAMILCPTCGNKRCPHATHHDNPCTGSNEPGQAGSNYA